MTKKKKEKKEKFPHFRYYRKSGHPALIVAEHTKEEYKYRKVSHSDQEGGRKSEKVYPNPNPKDVNPMYIARRVRHDKKSNFGFKYPWKYKKK